MKSKIKKFWYHDDVYKSVFYDSASIAIPYVEEHIINQISSIRHLIKDTHMLSKLELLLEEETAHSRVHHAYNAMLRREGYDFDTHVKVLLWLQKAFNSILTRNFNLALCVAMEHLTASMSLAAMHTGSLEDGIDEKMKRVWTWHFLEEIDHRSNAFDIYKYLGGSYLTRTTAMVLLIVAFFMHTLWVKLSLLAQDGRMLDIKLHVDGTRFLWGKNGIHRALIPALLNYFHPSFHPNKIRYPEILKREVHRYPIENELIKYFGK